jgi:monovalent cation:H+ antiporter-2, CPA2 family
MMTNSAVYFALAFVVFTAVLGGTIAHRLHRPLIIGYVLGGILIGFLLPRFPIIDVHTLELFAGIEVTLLMIWPGVEFSFLALLEIKWIAILGGLLGTLLSIALGLLAGRLVGWNAA